MSEKRMIELKRGGYVLVARDLNGIRLEVGWKGEGMASVDVLSHELPSILEAVQWAEGQPIPSTTPSSIEGDAG